MALTVVEQPPESLVNAGPPETFEAPPKVVTTPCDPWPRPYYLKDGLRRVAPYHFTYNTWCKERWRNKEILEIFATEFRDRTREYYKHAIETGGISINGKPAPSINTIIRNGDVISHTLHRHEPPVTALPISILNESSDMIVIDKPAGVPVHPAGRYNYNSVVEIMRAERGHGWNPMPCNRLDRLTSGVMFVGKHAKAAEELGRKLKGRTVRKEYVARVKGRFPDGEVLCDQPILQISPILGLNRARHSGKDATTVFKRIAYYPSSRRKNTGVTENHQESQTAGPSPAQPPAPSIEKENDQGYSIVHCLPLTGRTHQIRVHLQFLGHPISNDPIYASRRAFGPLLGAGDNTADNDITIVEALSKMGKTELADAEAYYDEVVEDYQRRKGEKMTGEKCEICGTELYSDPGVHELGIFLHAIRYADNGEDGKESKWEYQSDMPIWALPPQGLEGPTEMPRWEDDGDARVMGGIGAIIEGIGAVGLKAETGENETSGVQPSHDGAASS